MWRAGIEDELMPLGLQDHSVPGDLAASDALYQQATPESISAHASAGAFVTIAHTEGKTAETIDALGAAGAQAPRGPGRGAGLKFFITGLFFFHNRL